MLIKSFNKCNKVSNVGVCVCVCVSLRQHTFSLPHPLNMILLPIFSSSVFHPSVLPPSAPPLSNAHTQFHIWLKKTDMWQKTVTTTRIYKKKMQAQNRVQSGRCVGLVGQLLPAAPGLHSKGRGQTVSTRLNQPLEGATSKTTRWRFHWRPAQV